MKYPHEEIFEDFLGQLDVVRKRLFEAEAPGRIAALAMLEINVRSAVENAKAEIEGSAKARKHDNEELVQHKSSQHNSPEKPLTMETLQEAYDKLTGQIAQASSGPLLVRWDNGSVSYRSVSPDRINEEEDTVFLMPKEQIDQLREMIEGEGKRAIEEDERLDNEMTKNYWPQDTYRVESRVYGDQPEYPITVHTIGTPFRGFKPRRRIEDANACVGPNQWDMSAAASRLAREFSGPGWDATCSVADVTKQTSKADLGEDDIVFRFIVRRKKR